MHKEQPAFVVDLTACHALDLPLWMAAYAVDQLWCRQSPGIHGALEVIEEHMGSEAREYLADWKEFAGKAPGAPVIVDADRLPAGAVVAVLL